MPKYTEFTINVPDEVDVMAQDIISASEKLQTSNIEMYVQTQGISNSLDIIQQAKIFNNPKIAESISNRGPEDINTVYGKAEIISSASNKSSKEKELAIENIAKNYEYRSEKDSNRIFSLNLVIDGKEVKLEKLNETILHYYNTKDFNDYALEKPGSELYPSSPKLNKVTMDMVIDYLQETKNVEFSKKQRNFLRTQWNQASITGTPAAIIASGNIDENGLPPTVVEQDETFTFENGQLVKLQHHMLLQNRDENQSGNISTNVDVSHLRGEKSEQNPKLNYEDWIPQNTGKVSIQYNSDDDLSMEIDHSIVIAMGKNISGKEAAYLLSDLEFEEEPEENIEQPSLKPSISIEPKQNIFQKIRSRVNNIISNAKANIENITISIGKFLNSLTIKKDKSKNSDITPTNHPEDPISSKTQNITSKEVTQETPISSLKETKQVKPKIPTEAYKQQLAELVKTLPSKKKSLFNPEPSKISSTNIISPPERRNSIARNTSNRSISRAQ